jgi:glycosyltransferase involved in cell wall biosynthesis
VAGPPAITVAIPSCNGEKTLEVTLRSILAQTGPPFDLLLCDDASSDTTLGLARRIAGDRLRIGRNPTRLGLAQNWNRCVELASTPFVAIVHQDDLLLPGHLEAHVAVLASDPSLGMTVSEARPIDAEGGPIPGAQVGSPRAEASDRIFAPGEFVPMLAASNPVICSAVVLRREAHQALGGFDPTWRYAVDWEFWLRLARSWGVGWVARPTVEFRWHAGSETQRFHRGLLDLAEQERLLGPLWAELGDAPPAGYPEPGAWKARLGRAYLNRVYLAINAGRPGLAKRAWRRARTLWPGIAGEVARDPRLAARMGQLWLGGVRVSRRRGPGR